MTSLSTLSFLKLRLYTKSRLFIENFFLVTRFHTLNRDFSSNRELLNRDFTTIKIFFDSPPSPVVKIVSTIYHKIVQNYPPPPRHKTRPVPISDILTYTDVWPQFRIAIGCAPVSGSFAYFPSSPFIHSLTENRTYSH